MRISYWSSDVCSSDLPRRDRLLDPRKGVVRSRGEILDCRDACLTEALYCPPRLFQGLGKIALGIPSGQPSIDLADREGHARIGSNERADADEGSPRRFGPNRGRTRSEERGVGKEGVSTGRTRWSRIHYKKK